LAILIRLGENSLKLAPIKNIQGIYTNIKKIYSQTTILINIHQTEHHHTAEELRIIPAAVSGAIVISEKSPLLKHTFIERFALWSSVDKIPSLANNVLENLDFYHDQIFNERLSKRFKKLKKYNSLTARYVINRLENQARLQNLH
jgi:hypothetical protein